MYKQTYDATYMIWKKEKKKKKKKNPDINLAKSCLIEFSENCS